MNSRYFWVKNLSPQLPHMAEAIKLIGVKEIAGAKHNDEIMSWAKTLNVKSIHVSDEVPWCGLLPGISIRMAYPSVRLPRILSRARSWASFGVEVSAEDVSFGDIVVFQRDGGGHVGFYVAEDDFNFHILGGNQSNKVGIDPISKARAVAFRRIDYASLRVSGIVKKFFVSSRGLDVSKNEA